MNSLQSYTGIGQSPYVFSDTGRPQYGESSTYERDRNGRVVRRRIRYTITQWFLEGAFADNSARWTALRTALAFPEGILHIEDENGTVLVNRRVQVVEHGLPEQWSASLSEVKVGFETTEEISASVFDATFTPTGGSAIPIPQVQHWDERIDAERFSKLVPNRRESWHTVAANGSIRANPDDLPAARLATLQTAAAALRSLDTKEGVLAYGSFSQLMRVDRIVADLGDGGDELRWSIQCSRLAFPAGNYAEADYEVSQKDDVQNCTRLTSVAGNIRAYDDAGAASKAAAIAATYATGRALLSGPSLARKVLNGTDSTNTEVNTGEWTFALLYREVLPDAAISYELKVNDQTDFTTGIITSTYSGKVCAVSSAAALAKAAALGDGKYPIPVSSDLQVGTLSSGGSDEQFVDVTFSYVYHRRGTAKHAEVTMVTNVQPFGQVTQTVSGTAAADTQTNALAFARTFKPSGLLVDSKEEAATTYHGTTPDTLFLRQSFSYTIQTGQSGGTLEYMKDVSQDRDTRRITITYAGTARSTTATAADALISALIASETGTLMIDDRKPFNRTDGTNAVYDRTDFSIQFTALLTNTDTILQARAEVESIYSVNNAVLSEIPYGNPYAQSNTGVTIGRKIISGTVTSTEQTEALTWARSLMAAGSGGYLMRDPREKWVTDYMPRTTATVQKYTLEFTYAYQFTSLPMV